MIRDPEKHIVVGVTGASGAAYARRLIQLLAESGVTVHCVLTPNGRRLFMDELNQAEVDAKFFSASAQSRILIYPYRDVGAVIASGSFLTEGMIVCPCSTNSLASIACGLGDNLLARAAAVTLKERRRLILLIREMPLTLIDLRNAERVTEAGGIICPASPGLYLKPRGIEDLVDFVVGKLLDLVGVPHPLDTRWLAPPHHAKADAP